MDSPSVIPSSIRGTSPGAGISSTNTDSSRIWTRSLYIRVRTVASVARTQIFLYPPSMTASAPGMVTHNICFSGYTSCWSQRRALTLAVLHASTTTSAHRSKSFCTHIQVSFCISCWVLLPYGAFSRSISSIILISGYSFWKASITTPHPSPESKNQTRIIKNQRSKISLIL